MLVQHKSVIDSFRLEQQPHVLILPDQNLKSQLPCLAAAEKQITIAPPPPPSTTAATPGLDVGFLIPGYNSNTFGSAQAQALCQALVAATTGYNQNYIQCSISGSKDVNSVQGGVIATGYLNWQEFQGATAQDRANAAGSRDQMKINLAQNTPAILSKAFPNSVLDCSCNPSFDASPSTQTFNIPGVPLATCVMSPKVSGSHETPTSSMHVFSPLSIVQLR